MHIFVVVFAVYSWTKTLLIKNICSENEKLTNKTEDIYQLTFKYSKNDFVDKCTVELSALNR